MTGFVVDIGYIDQPGSTEVLAYSSRGALLATVRAGSVGMNRITVSASDIRSFVVRSTGVESSGWAIDNFRFQGFAGAIRTTGLLKAPAHVRPASTGGSN